MFVYWWSSSADYRPTLGQHCNGQRVVLVMTYIVLCHHSNCHKIITDINIIRHFVSLFPHGCHIKEVISIFTSAKGGYVFGHAGLLVCLSVRPSVGLLTKYRTDFYKNYTRAMEQFVKFWGCSGLRSDSKTQITIRVQNIFLKLVSRRRANERSIKF